MNRYISLLPLTLMALFMLSNVVFADVYVRGYTRKDGTYVQPHYRSNPDGNFYNNWSTKGNVNPYTGRPGTLVTPRSRSAYTPSGNNTYNWQLEYQKRQYNSLFYSNSQYRRSTTGNTNNYAGAYTGVTVNPQWYEYYIGTYDPSMYFDVELDTSMSDSIEKPRQVKPDEVFEPGDELLFNSSDYETRHRVRAAARLKEMGLNVKWSDYSYEELSNFESRVASAKRLETHGVILDWQNHSASELLDIELRVQAVEQLADVGVVVVWQSYSISELLDFQSRWKAGERLRKLGFTFNWEDYSLSQILDWEQRIHCANRLNKAVGLGIQIDSS